MGCLSRSVQMVMSQRVSDQVYGQLFPPTTPEQLTRTPRVLRPDMAHLQTKLQESVKGIRDVIEFAQVGSGRSWIALQLFCRGPVGPDGTPETVLLEEWIFQCEYDPAPRQGGPREDDSRKAVLGLRKLATVLCLTPMQEVHSIVSTTTGLPGDNHLGPLHEFWTHETYPERTTRFPERHEVQVQRVECALLGPESTNMNMSVSVQWRTDALHQYAAATQAHDCASEFGAASADGSGSAEGGAHREYGAASTAPIHVQLDYFDASHATDPGAASAAQSAGDAAASIGERPPAPASTAPVIPIAAGHPAPSASSAIGQGGRPHSLGLLSHQGPSSLSSAHRSSPEHGRSLPANAAHAMPDVMALHLDAARAVSRDSTNVHIMEQPPSPPRDAAATTALFAGDARRASMSLPGVGTPLAEQLITPEVNVSVTTSAESSVSPAHSEPAHLIIGSAEPARTQQSLAISDLSYTTLDVDGPADADIVTPESAAESRAHSAFGDADSAPAVELSPATTGSRSEDEGAGDCAAGAAQAPQQQPVQAAPHAETRAAPSPEFSIGQSVLGHTSGNASDGGAAAHPAAGSSASPRSSQASNTPASHAQAHAHSQAGAAAQASSRASAGNAAPQIDAPASPARTRAEAARQLLDGIPSDLVLSTTWGTYSHEELSGTLTVL